MEIEFEFERTTKNTARYKEVVDGDAQAQVGTLYVQKWSLGHEFGTITERLIVTIEEAD